MTSKALRPVLLGAALALAFGQIAAPSLADPFKLGVEEQKYIESGGGSYGYPAPVAVPVVQPPRLNGNVQQQQQPQLRPQVPVQQQVQQRPPMQMQIQKTVELPRDFLGAWMVQGQRQKVDAQPEFQATAESAFATQTSNIWNISGSPQAGYSLGSNTGISTQLWVDKVQGGTAFIRYQHPIGKTMAQEAIVMSLVPGGMQFNGLERISIVKEGGPPRAKVTYQLIGQRQR